MAAAPASFNTVTLAISFGFMFARSPSIPSIITSGDPPLIELKPRILILGVDEGSPPAPERTFNPGTAPCKELAISAEGRVSIFPRFAVLTEPTRFSSFCVP